jgi:drug/metabolite transporter (DMT)-like permease
MNPTLAGTLLVILSSMGYAVFGLFSKIALREGVHPAEIVTWRFVLATTLFWISFPLWRRYARLPDLTRRDLIQLFVLGGIFATGGITAFLALARITASTAAILGNMSPAVVAIMGVFTGERLPKIGWLAIALSLIGCVLTAGGELQLSDPIGIGWALVNVVVISLYITLAGRFTRHLPGITSGIMVITSACIVTVIFNLIGGVGMPSTAPGWLAVGGLGLFSTVLAVTALLTGVALIGAPRASIISTSALPMALTLAAIFLGERLNPIQYAGGALILASIILLQLPGRQRTVVISE